MSDVKDLERLPMKGVSVGALVGALSVLVVLLLVLFGTLASRESRDVRAPSHPLERSAGVARDSEIPPPDEASISNATSAPTLRPPSTTKPAKKVRNGKL